MGSSINVGATKFHLSIVLEFAHGLEVRLACRLSFDHMDS